MAATAFEVSLLPKTASTASSTYFDRDKLADSEVVPIWKPVEMRVDR